jgi:hypothetical protein
MAEEDKDGSTPQQSLTGKQETAIPDVNMLIKEVRVSSILQGLLDEHKAQSVVVESLKSELNDLEENPQLFFQNRKRFLYHAYTQTLDECKTQLSFDVKVLTLHVKTDESLMPVTLYQIGK